MWRSTAITAVFGYALVANVVERPDGIKIAAIFILAILTTSFGSRVHRAFELRVTGVRLDEEARRLIDRAAADGPLQLIAHEPADVTVHGTERDGAARLSVQGPTVPNTIAAILLALRDRTGEVPHVHFSWSEGGPVGRLLRFLVFGDGEVAPVTREVLRRAEPDTQRRSRVHVS